MNKETCFDDDDDDDIILLNMAAKLTPGQTYPHTQITQLQHAQLSNKRKRKRANNNPTTSPSITLPNVNEPNDHKNNQRQLFGTDLRIYKTFRYIPIAFRFRNET